MDRKKVAEPVQGLEEAPGIVRPLAVGVEPIEPGSLRPLYGRCPEIAVGIDRQIAEETVEGPVREDFAV